MERATAMKKPTVRYSKGEIGQVNIVEDFLPSPDRLVLREDNVKVTLSLSQRSVAFFKRRAATPGALSAYDPGAGGRLCGEAGREGVMRLSSSSGHPKPSFSRKNA